MDIFRQLLTKSKIRNRVYILYSFLSSRTFYKAYYEDKNIKGEIYMNKGRQAIYDLAVMVERIMMVLVLVKTITVGFSGRTLLAWMVGTGMYWPFYLIVSLLVIWSVYSGNRTSLAVHSAIGLLTIFGVDTSGLYSELDEMLAK